MYAPPHNRIEDIATRLAFMREYNFAALITGAGSGLQATHLPFVIVEEGGKLRLVAHLALANPQWRDFANGVDVLVIFAGPHAYVSPSLYARKPSLPTWNYIAVHAYGKLRRLDARADKLRALEGLIDLHDPAYRSDFAELPADYLTAKLGGIVAFEIEVARLEARFKLSQDRSVSERERIADVLSEHGDGAAGAVASGMRRIDPPQN